MDESRYVHNGSEDEEYDENDHEIMKLKLSEQLDCEWVSRE